MQPPKSSWTGSPCSRTSPPSTPTSPISFSMMASCAPCSLIARATSRSTVVLPEPRKPAMQRTFTPAVAVRRVARGVPSAAAGEQLRPEVPEGELVAGRGDDEVVAPVFGHERVEDPRRARHLLDGEVEGLGEVGDARPVRLHVVAAGVDEHDARVVLEQQAHHLLGPLPAALLHELLVLAHDGVALLEVRLGDVVAAALLLGLGGERLVGAEEHGDAVVDAGDDEGGVLGLEAEDGVGAEAVAEDDGRARLRRPRRRRRAAPP